MPHIHQIAPAGEPVSLLLFPHSWEADFLLDLLAPARIEQLRRSSPPPPRPPIPQCPKTKTAASPR